MKHQKDWRDKRRDPLAPARDRGAVAGRATTYRKGACANCGAATHKTKDCVDRPRARGAKLTGTDIAPDEATAVVERSTFDGRHDRWEGYDPADHATVIEFHEKVEAAKAAAKRRAELEKRFGDGASAGGSAPAAGDSDSESDGDGDRVAAAADAPFAKLEKAVRSAGGGASGTVRNLRLREDTAKYLRDLDPDSAHYDPKSRSMRGGPDDAAASADGFTRGGDAGDFLQLQAHAAAAFDRGHDVNAFGAPSQAAALHAAFRAKKAALDAGTREKVVAAYGSAATEVDEATRKLLLGQTEAYIEYTPAGKPVGAAPAPAASRYEEDVLPGNHTAVWGSWFDVRSGAWGYACCRATARAAYCLGAAGAAAAAAAADDMAANLAARAAADAARRDAADEAAPAPRSAAPPPGAAAARWGGDAGADAELDPEKLKSALEAQEEGRKGKRRAREEGGAITAEELEAYRLKRGRADDPMAPGGAGGGGGTGGYDFV